MRFVSSLPPPPSVKEEDEPHPSGAVRRLRPVDERTRVPRAIQRSEPRTGAEGGGVEITAVRLDTRSTGDRRELCRRLQHGHPFLDTRNAIDRRKKSRRDGDIVTTLDEEG